MNSILIISAINYLIVSNFQYLIDLELNMIHLCILPNFKDLLPQILIECNIMRFKNQTSIRLYYHHFLPIIPVYI